MKSDTGTAVFQCDLSQPTVSFQHFWEHTVGSCHATMALRADWQAQLKQCSTELGFKHVRFHGILSDDMGTLVDENDTFVYSFFNIDRVCDFLLSIGMKPFMELSFMPTILASGNDIVFHYKGNVTPPKDYDQWEILIHKLVKHLTDRYGVEEVSQWFFEVWNEPNLDAFWKGTQAEYFKLYQHTAKAVKEVDASLKVGGPATADNEWITDFVSFCQQNNVPFDFISTHHYPTDSFGKPGDDTITQLSESRRSVLRDEAMTVKQQADGKPVYYTEWCTSSNPFDDLHDEPYAAAFIIKTVMEAIGVVQGYSYWTFSDLFEENYFSSMPFHGGFGLMTIYGIPKPAYRAFELLHCIGNEQLTVQGKHQTLDAWITRNNNKIDILVTNWALPRHDISTETVKIDLHNMPEIKDAYVAYIDDNNTNAKQAWAQMNSPESLLPAQVSALQLASALVKKPLSTKRQDGLLSIELEMMPQSVGCITLEIA